MGAKLFPPRGLSGISKLIDRERLRVDLRTTQGFLSINPPLISQLRIPQSVWIPLINQPGVYDVSSFRKSLSLFDWKKLVPLRSPGPRLTVSKDNPGFDAGDKSAILTVFKHQISLYGLDENEFSIRIDHESNLSIQTNGIPPRPWQDLPIELTQAEAKMNRWSIAAGSPPEDPTETAIKIYRNETSLSCLCAGLVQASPLGDWLSRSQEHEYMVWDPFAGHGSILLETLLLVFDRSSEIIGDRKLTILANAKSKNSLNAIIDKIERFRDMYPEKILKLPAEVQGEQQAGKLRGRRSRNKEVIESEKIDLDDKHIETIFRTIPLQIGNLSITIHLSTLPFHEMMPYVNGGLVLTHIPKTYSEMTGIDKHSLTEWAVLGNFLKEKGPSLDMYVFSETNSFFKYTKLKYAKLFHLVSPSGRHVASYSKWLGI